MRYRRDPRPPAIGLEDNYQIEVWDKPGGTLLGVCARASNHGVIRAAWRAAIEEFPGRYLIEKNDRFEVGHAEVPPAEPDEHGSHAAGGISLDNLPQWYDLAARCKCGHVAMIDRYSATLKPKRGWPLRVLEPRLRCTACGQKGTSEIGAFKKPR